MSEFTVACVLKSGKFRYNFEYLPKHVYRLRDMVEEHLLGPHSFVCLTDRDDLECDTIPLEMGWPGWWSKLELFRHDLGRTIYFDLDITIQKSISWMIPLTLYNFCAPKVLPKFTKGYFDLAAIPEDSRDDWTLASQPMCWEGPQPHLLEGFTMAESKRFRGDQNWICHKQRPHGWKGLFHCNPTGVASFRRDTATDRARASIVSYHGTRKPWGSQ